MSRPLRILHVSTAHTWRGGESQAALLIAGQLRRGCAVQLVAQRGGAFAARAPAVGVEAREIAMRGEFDLLAVKRLHEAVRAFGPDVVHLHDARGLMLAGLAAGLARRKTGRPARVFTRRVDFPLKAAWKYRRLCERVIAISEAVRGVLVGCGLPESAVRLVYSGVDLERLRVAARAGGRAALGLPAEAKAILCVAALTDHKGHTYLLRALPEVLGAFPQARLFLCGEGELEAALQAQVKALKIGDKVKFLGFREDVPDLIAASDVFVMPSHLEGLCTSLMDALWLQRVAVVSDVGGLPEVAGTGEEQVATVVRAKDSRALAEGLKAALAPTPELLARAARGRERVERFFSAEAMVNGTLAVYEELLG